jgi:hypothetical protein
MRIRAVALAHVVTLVVATSTSSVAYADEYGGWRFQAPEGTRSTDGGHISFTKITGTTFCQFALFPARPPTGSDVAYEWRTVVAANFTASNLRKPLSGSTANLGFVATSATLTQKDGVVFEGTLVVLAAPGAVTSVMVTSTTVESLSKCPTKAFIDSISLAPAPAAPASAAATQPQPAAAPVAPAADGAPLLTTSWGTSSSAYIQGLPQGYVRRQYTFEPDSTYRYYSETWGGANNSTWYYVVDESGTWKLDGSKLTLSPKKAVGTQYDDKGNVKKSAKVALEKTTYAIQSAYMSGIQEWNLVMTPPKQTRRDGPFATSAAYPNSYLMSNSYRAEWKFPPK